MSRESFRFIHATQVLIDQPLTGAGPLSSDERRIVEDAPHAAFARIIEACLEHEAAFLLLTGNTFDEHHASLRSRVALEDGLETLAAHDIPVFLVPGSTDSPAALRRCIALPRNVTAFLRDDCDPVPATRDGRTLALVFPVATAHTDEAAWRIGGPAAMRGATANTFRIGLVGAGIPSAWDKGPVNPAEGGSSTAASGLVRAAIDGGVNYLAVGEGRRSTHKIRGGIAHDPGSPLGRRPSDTGPHGCSLVSVDAQGECHVRLIPTATVRWEEATLSVDHQTSWDDLVEGMQLAILEREPQTGEQLWLLQWLLRGTGSVIEALADRPAQQELWELLEQELGDRQGTRRRHLLTRSVRRGDVPSESAAALQAEFLERVQTNLAEKVSRFRREAQTPDRPEAPWVRVLERFLHQLRPQAVVERCRELATLLFS